MSRFVKLPSMMYVSLLGLLLACPVSPVKDIIVETTTRVAFLAPATALGAFAGISLGKDLKEFAKMGWKLVVITLFVITGTFIFSALVADVRIFWEKIAFKRNQKTSPYHRVFIGNTTS
mgnify:CR=1 FL=1